MLLDMAENGVRAHLRNDLYHPEHLVDWFAGMLASAHLAGVRLQDGAGNAMLRLGAFAEATFLDPSLFLETSRGAARLEGLPRGGRGRGASRGPGVGAGWTPLPPGPYTFTVAWHAAPWRERQARSTRLAFAGAGLTSLCGMLSLLALRLMRRQQSLRGELKTSEARAERQTALARMGAGLAHETKNPLGVIRGLAQAIRDDVDVAETTRQRAAHIIDETDRVVGQIDGFLTLARPVEPHLETIAVAPFLRQLRTLLADEARMLDLDFRVDAEDFSLLADPELLRRALLNLLLNAFKASSRGGAVRLSSYRQPDGNAVIEVLDAGCGIAPEDLPRLTTPYFTRFEDGVGLGLALVSEIAEAHGWRLDFDSELGKGARVRLADIVLSRAAS